ncbi:MAG: dihydroorotate dehydrogenase [Candidatus Omnitrophica bacterium]|nr:dihydroorotate dehydrogenase [Candidatus Omnitrophota bacterium]
MANLRVALGSLTLRNPVLAAAGTFGYGVEFAQAVRLSRLGALVTKTLTREARDGHPPPRLVETPSGMLNAVGLQNVGLDAFLREVLPALRRHDVPVIVSILGESPEELAEMTRTLDRADGASAIELNLSCPNLNSPAGLIAQDPEATFTMVQAAAQRTRKPVLAKLSPDVTDLTPIAQAAERAGASALTVGNTFIGMSLDPAARRSRLGTLTGGLSGPAIRPLAVYRVWYTARSVRIPVIGVGGIVRAADALEFLLAGAAAVGVGTAHFADPRAALRVLVGIERYLNRHRIGSVRELSGALRQP